VAMDGASVERLLTDLGEGVRYLSGAEYAAYLHTSVTGDARSLRVDYDPHYCRAFAAKDSAWTLHLSDETRRALGNQVPEKRVVRLPQGVSSHIVRAAQARW